jgi:hypothetical protein
VCSKCTNICLDLCGQKGSRPDGACEVYLVEEVYKGTPENVTNYILRKKETYTIYKILSEIGKHENSNAYYFPISKIT